MSARILIIDDDLASCRLFAKVLTSEGYSVEWVQSGEEAMAQLKKSVCDLLLTDLRLPGMTGLAVTRAVRASDASLPVIVMTGFGSIRSR